MLVEVVYCKDCKHRPFYDPPESTHVWDIKVSKDANGYSDHRCPCVYFVPKDDFYCAYGERKTEKYSS